MATVLQIALLVTGIETVTIDPVVIARDGDGGDVCPNVQDGLQTFRESVVDALIQYSISQHIFGDGLWVRVAHLNMSDPSQQCPLQH